MTTRENNLGSCFLDGSMNIFRGAKFVSVLLLLILIALYSNGQTSTKAPGNYNITLRFKHVVNEQPLVLDDSSYINPFGESYTIHKLKYYIGQLQFFTGGKMTASSSQYFLINHSLDSSCSIHLRLPENSYDSIQFLIGVDSAMNTAGAQAGALDPLNDMFWTWQSGYIMQKLEGWSPQSGVVNNKMEYHLGGYGGLYKTQRLVTIAFAKPVEAKKKGQSSIVIKADINKFWQGKRDLSIKETPVCSSIGMVASQLASNFAGMFLQDSVINN